MALDPRQLFDIQSEFAEVTETARFGKTIFITTDDTLGVTGGTKTREFVSFTSALKFFDDANPTSGPTGSQVRTEPVSEPAKAVQAYYKQQKNNPIRVVRWLETAVGSSLSGGGTLADRTTLTVISDGQFYMVR